MALRQTLIAAGALLVANGSAIAQIAGSETSTPLSSPATTIQGHGVSCEIPKGTSARIVRKGLWGGGFAVIPEKICSRTTQVVVDGKGHVVSENVVSTVSTREVVIPLTRRSGIDNNPSERVPVKILCDDGRTLSIDMDTPSLMDVIPELRQATCNLQEGMENFRYKKSIRDNTPAAQPTDRPASRAQGPYSFPAAQP